MSQAPVSLASARTQDGRRRRRTAGRRPAAELFGRLNDDLDVWRSLQRFQPDLFCGLFMSTSNDGFYLPADALLALAQRGIALNLDAYDPSWERDDDPLWRPL